MSFNSVIFDKKTISEALNESIALIRGRWWQVWWRLFAPQGILLFFFFFLSIISAAVGLWYGSKAEEFSNIIVTFFLNVFVAIPLIYLPAIILFEDLKKSPLIKK